MKCFVMAGALLVTLAHLSAAAEELPEEAQRILDDLGPVSLQQRNNDKLQHCIYSGTKKVTVSPLEDATVFAAEYNNCRQKGSTQDGYYEVIVKGGEVIGRSSQRSVNGKLFDVVRAGDLAKAKELIRKKANVNYSESISSTDGGKLYEWTPLMSAVVNGNLAMVKLLVGAGAWVNYLNSNVFNAVWLAANNGHADIVSYLISRQAFINNQNLENVTPLIAAAMNGHLEVVRLLLGAGCDVDRVHKDGDSALMFALANGHTAIARILIDAGADVAIQNRFGVTALIIATAEGNAESVRQLLEKRADVRAKTDGGKTARDIAVAKGYADIATFLQEAELKSNAPQ